MISIELLRQITKEEVTHVGEVMKHNNSLQYSTDKSVHYTLNKHINIYEMQHFVKQFAMDNHKLIFSRTNIKNGDILGAISYIIDDFYIDKYQGSRIMDSFKAKTEVEAVVFAGEMVLNEINT